MNKIFDLINAIPHNSLIVMLVIILALGFASLLGCILSRKNKDKDYTELTQRINSWWIIIITVFSVLIISKNLTILFFAFISFLALKEFLSIVPIRRSDRRAVFWAYLTIPAQYYLVAKGWYGLFIIFIPVYAFLFLPMRLVLIGNTKGFINSAGILHWATMLTVFSISHIAYLLVLPDINPSAGNIGLVIFILFITQLNDIFQYIWGKLVGKRKIIPKVSPNKTWEGFLGGMFSITLCSAVCAPWLTPLTMFEGILIGLLISFAGFIGDVVISSVKRDLQIKDSGTLIPGHGGILDRVDSLLYTAPIFFHFIYYLYY